MPSQKVAFFQVLTPLHLQSGTTHGVVRKTLPRGSEGHPEVQMTTMQGALRRSLKHRLQGDADGLQILESPSALMLGEARLLALPLRALTGLWGWVTCPAILSDLAQQVSTSGLSLPNWPAVERQQIACAADNLLAENGKVVLEEYEFVQQGDATELAQWLAQNALSADYGSSDFAQRLGIISDELFGCLVQQMPGLMAWGYQPGQAPHSLHYTEFLPPETLLYAALQVTEPAESLLPKLPACLTVGAQLSLGNGVCALNVAGDKEGSIA